VLGEALVAGGIPVAEVTLRTAAGLDSIAEMAKNPDLLVGAGTVITADQVDRVVEVGARFIVSPGLNPRVVERALEHGIDVVPGAVTPSEIMTALELGLTTLKFFPANVYGGPSALKALGAPFGNVSFIPTGGVSTTNIAEYLALKNVVAVGGSWMVPANLINDGEFDTIRQLCTDAVAAIQGDN
jgi:2-dehydro-3-deoxyphosphogluconate aldolase/(4S)-4-hydroxy-2-oxoglutarate aldolase